MESFGLLNLLKSLLSTIPEKNEDKNFETTPISKNNNIKKEEGKILKQENIEHSQIAFSSFMEKHERISRNIDLHKK